MEDRLTPGVAAEEQLFVYLLNFARHDPDAYARREHLHVSLADTVPRPPLAANDLLFDSSEFRSNDMATRNYYAHTSPEGHTPWEAITNAGYQYRGAAESIVAGTPVSAGALNVLLTDDGIDPPAHRIQLLAMAPYYAALREIGVGHSYVAASDFGDYWAVHTGSVGESDVFLTGVVFDDLNGNRTYDLDEGLSGVTVDVDGDSVTTNAAGGWSVRVTPGVKTVRASGGAFAGTSSSTVTVDDRNIEVDFRTGQGAADLNFEAAENHAPVLNTAQTVTLPGVRSNNIDPPGQPLATFIDGLILDPDAGAVKGVAITATTGAGTWQFSSDGGRTWDDIGEVSDASARLLPDEDWIRFVPGRNTGDTATVTFRAWDRTDGTAGGSADLTTLDASSLSAATSRLMIPITVIRPTPAFAVGSDQGSPATVNYYGPDHVLRFTLTPYGSDFAGGVRPATADANGDGVEDLVVASGPGRTGNVRVYDGVNRSILFDTTPFEDTFTRGINVSAGDLTGDGLAEIVVTAETGGGARVLVFRPGTGDFARLVDFVALIGDDGTPDTEFRGGGRSAVGDINGDGYGDLIFAAGIGGGPRIAIFDGKTLAQRGELKKLRGDFFAFESTLRNGTYVTAGDFDGDGKAELVAGAGAGGAPRVSVFSGAGLLITREDRIADFYGGADQNRYGIRVSVKDLDNDDLADLVVGAADNGSAVTGYTGRKLRESPGSPTPDFDSEVFAGSAGGVFVG